MDTIFHTYYTYICIKQFISAVGYGVTLTCVVFTCTTLRTVVAAAALLVVGTCTARCFECFCVVHRVLSAVPVVVVVSGSSVAWRCVVGTIGAPVVLVVLPVLAPGVTLSVVGVRNGNRCRFRRPGTAALSLSVFR